MPRLWKTAVRKIAAKGDVDNPYAVATASLQKAGDLKPGTRDLTQKGSFRQRQGAEWRHEHPPGGKK